MHKHERAWSYGMEWREYMMYNDAIAFEANYVAAL